MILEGHYVVGEAQDNGLRSHNGPTVKLEGHYETEGHCRGILQLHNGPDINHIITIIITPLRWRTQS